jgi:hypothetical protein
MKSLFKSWSVDPATLLPKDRLGSKDLAAGKDVQQAQSGIPATAELCAYEPIQRLLAVSAQRFCLLCMGINPSQWKPCAPATPSTRSPVRWATRC